MKRFLACLLVVCSFQGVKAQIGKGSIFLGGQLSYSKNSGDLNSTPNQQISKSGNLNVSIGKAFSENAVFGVTLGYAPQSLNNYSGSGTTYFFSEEKRKYYNAGVFYRKYKQLAGKFFFFGEGSIGYTGLRQSFNTIPGNTKTVYKENGGQLVLTPGISYNLFRKLQAEVLIPSLLSVRYTHASTKQNQFAVSTGFGNTNTGFLGVGFHFIF